MDESWIIVSDEKDPWIKVCEDGKIHRGSWIHMGEFSGNDLDPKTHPLSLEQILSTMTEIQCDTFHNSIIKMMRELNSTGHGTNLEPKPPMVSGISLDPSKLGRHIEKAIVFIDSRDTITDEESRILSRYLKNLKQYIDGLPVVMATVT